MSTEAAIALAALFVTIIIAILTFVWRVSRNSSEGDAKLHKRFDDFIRDFGAHREAMALLYLTRNDAKDMEGRLMARLESIDGKLDRVIEGRGGS
jgi:hypothetical protein